MFCGFLFFIAGSFLHAQNPVFTARVSGTTVAQNTVFSVQFELKNASTSQFEPPSFKGFRIVGGPSTSSSTMIVNGEVSKSQSWTYSLLASDQGKQTIEAARVRVNGKTLNSKPISIQVTESAPVPQPGVSTDSNEPVFLIAELNDSIYYPGQQIILTYRILFKENVQSVNPISEDDYANFYVQRFSNINPLASFEMINGEQYTSRVVKSLALYAHQSGTYELDPLIISAGISGPAEANRGFFSMRRLQNVQVASSPVTIHVEPLPADIPESFSGAVGQYDMNVSFGTRPLTTNNAFAFTVEFTGNGDARRWELPEPVTDGSFELYTPRVMSDERWNEIDGEMKQKMTVMYQMLPKEPGEFSIHLPFTYFDPQQGEYVTIRSDTVSRQVALGDTRATVQRDEREDRMPELMVVGRPLLQDRFWASFPHLLLFGLFLSGTFFGIARVWQYEKEQRIPAARRKSRDAAIGAEVKLTALEQSIESTSDKSFFEQATEIYYSFLIDRFAIPAGELDEEHLDRYLSDAGIETGLAAKAKAFFSQCLTVRYGGIPGGFQKSEMLSACRTLIESLSV